MYSFRRHVKGKYGLFLLGRCYELTKLSEAFIIRPNLNQLEGQSLCYTYFVLIAKAESEPLMPFAKRLKVCKILLLFCVFLTFVVLQHFKYSKNCNVTMK